MFKKFFDKIESLFVDSTTTIHQSYVKSVSDAEYDVDINWSNTRGEDGNVILSIGEQLVNINSITFDGSSYNEIIHFDGKHIVSDYGKYIEPSRINWTIKYKVDRK